VHIRSGQKGCVMAAKKKKPQEKDAGASGSTRSMRDEAEKELTRSTKISPELARQTPEELIHELRVHQIELEMQAEELRKAHLALEESRDKYLDLYEFAPIGYLALTDTALIADVNLTCATLLGVERSKLKQARFRKFVAPHDVDAWDQYFMSVLQHEKTPPVTLLLKRSDDSVFPARLESIRLSGKSDGTTIIRVAISDITDIRQAEEAKRETSAWLKFALHSAKAGTWDWDFPSGKLVWSPEFYELFSLPPEAPPSFETWLATLHPDDRTPAMEKIDQSVKEHRDLWNEYRILLPDGGWRWIGAAGSTSYNNSGEPLRMSGVCIDITERKRAEEALREKEARLSLALDVGKAGVWEWNLETDTVYFDARFHALLGYDPGELPTTLKGWMHYLNQEDVPVWMGKAQAYFRGDSPVYESEHRIRTKAGDWAWVFNRGRLMTRTTIRSPKLFIGFAMNITNRKTAEDALRESEDKFRSLFEHMAAGSCVDEVIYKGGKAADYRVLDVNSAYEEILGISKSQAIGALASQIYGTGEAPFLNVYSNVAETGEPVKFEAWFEPSRKHLQITVSCPAKGKFSTVFTDITNRKQVEGEIKRSFERFKTVMDGLDALVYVVDRETYELLFINKYGKDLWGEIEGQTCWKTIQSGQSGPCPFCTNDKLVDSDGNPTGVYHWEFQNTVTRKWYDCRDSAIRWLDGRLVRLEIATDITERKRADTAIALTNRKLALMNDVAYQDIQNKVTALRGYSELSKDTKTEAERLAFIAKEEKILADIHQLIKNTKQYQEMGLSTSQWKSVEYAIKMAAALTSRETPVSIDADLHELELYSDPLIERVFFQLIDNAMKHGVGLTQITFSCHEVPDGLILVCEDDGAGIDPQKRALLFSRITGDKARFGLFFVKEFLAISGMTISETSEPGKGARFEITVPKGMYRFTGTGGKIMSAGINPAPHPQPAQTTAPSGDSR